MKTIHDFKNQYEKLDITDENVYSACSLLDQEDLKPTYENLRLLFGRGSNSVLTPGKRKWETDKVSKADLNTINPTLL